MTDREKVVNAFVLCRVNERCSTNCPYWDGNTSVKECTKKLATDVYSLLKEQEAVKPKCKERIGGFVAGICPTCGTALNNVLNAKACGKCGQAVKWE